MPLAPHQNGCAESMVKSFKQTLKKAVRRQCLTPFKLHTCLQEGVNLVNERLIGRIPNDLMMVLLEWTTSSYLALPSSQAMPQWPQKGTSSQDAVENLDDLRSVEGQVLHVDQLNEKGVKLNPSEISAIYNLKSRKMNDKTKPNIIIRFSSRKSKGSIIKQAKDVKLGNYKIYVSEPLNAQNAHIATIARRIRKSERIDSTWVRNSKVFIRELINKSKN